jgi:GTP-binding protein Era
MQLVFIDTPGFLHHKMGVKEGVRKLLGVASAEMESADFTLLVVDAARNLEEDLKRTLISLIFLALRSRGRNEECLRVGETNNSDSSKNAPLNKFAVVVNKVDLVNPKEKLLMVANDVGSMAESCIRRLLEQRRNPTKVMLGDLVDDVLQNYTEEEGFDKVHEDDIALFAEITPEFLFTAAIKKDDEGVDDVLGLLLERATPSRDWIVDPDSPSGMSPVEQVEEIIREKIYRCLHREVPHSVTQQNRMFRLIEPKKSSSDSTEMNLLRIHQDLIVKTKSHQRLVMGSGGKTLERIRSTAVRDLEEAFECEVDLNLNVRISTSNAEALLESESEGAISFAPEH